MSAALGLALVLTAPMADLVVTNAKVWTDGGLQTADFIAIRDGKFVRIGKSDKSLIGSETVVFDAKGRVVTPGLIDAHTHLLDGGASLKYELDLRPARNKAEFIRMVRERAATLPKGHWLVGNGWSTESYPDPVSYTHLKAALDEQLVVRH